MNAVIDPTADKSATQLVLNNPSTEYKYKYVLYFLTSLVVSSKCNIDKTK
jgi:hypothetical protein